MNGLVGAKISGGGGGAGQARKGEKTNGLEEAKKGGEMGQPKEKRENEWINKG